MRVLIAHDPEADDPLPIADLRRAGLPSRSEVVVLCVADALLPPAPEERGQALPLPPRVQTAVDAAGRAAAAACTALRTAFPAWTIASDAVVDAPAWGVVRAAQRWRSEIIVMGARRHSALARVTLGSVSQTVLQEASCSVRLVRNGAEDGNRPPRLLIGIDGSADAEAAVAAVAARQWPNETIADLIFVVDSRAGGGDSSPDAEPSMQTRLEQLAQRLTSSGIRPVTAILTGDASSVLVQQAQRCQTDCIFVGARGLSRIERILLGSVSASVAARAACTVEVVRM